MTFYDIAGSTPVFSVADSNMLALWHNSKDVKRLTPLGVICMTSLCNGFNLGCR